MEMASAVALRVRGGASAIADCCPGSCAYSPSRVRKILRLMDELAQSGYEPCESLMDALVRETTPENVAADSPYARDRAPYGPADPTGAQIAADIWRAIRAGKRDPRAVALFLCPMAVDADADGGLS